MRNRLQCFLVIIGIHRVGTSANPFFVSKILTTYFTMDKDQNNPCNFEEITKFTLKFYNGCL